MCLLSLICIAYLCDRIITVLDLTFNRFTDFQPDFDYAVMATPQMLELLAESEFVQADVTFPKTRVFPYLLNMVAYNPRRCEFQVVARVLMSRLSGDAYKKAFGKVFEITTNCHPHFDNGNGVTAWIVDFSDAQYNGIASNLENIPDFVIRGCSVHFQRNAEKTLQKVCVDESAKKLFRKIAFKLPYLEEKEDVIKAFDILTGVLPITNGRDFMELTNDEVLVKQTGWGMAMEWAKWWTRPRHLKMFSKSWKLMSDEDWAACPTTTNAIESHNKISHSKTCQLSGSMQHYYQVDKRAAYETLAVEAGVTLRGSLKAKKRKHALRVLRRKKKGRMWIQLGTKTMKISVTLSLKVKLKSLKQSLTNTLGYPFG